MQTQTQTAYASTSTGAQPLYYSYPTVASPEVIQGGEEEEEAMYMPMNPNEYMPFQAHQAPQASGPASTFSPPLPVPVTFPTPTFSPPSPPLPIPDPGPRNPHDIHDSGIDLGSGFRPSNSVPPLPAPQPQTSNPGLFHMRSRLGFAKTQSRLGFTRPRPMSVATTQREDDLPELNLDADLDSEHEVGQQTTGLDMYNMRNRLLIENALVEELRPIIESCIDILARMIPGPRVAPPERHVPLQLGFEEEACASVEGTLRHLWSCITLRPGCTYSHEGEEGEDEGDLCRDYHDAFQRKLRRFTVRMKTFKDQIDRPRRVRKASFGERLYLWRDLLDQWINRFEKLNTHLRLRLAHGRVKTLQAELDREREALVATELDASDDGETSELRLRRSFRVQTLKEECAEAKSALLEAHRRAGGLVWRRDGTGVLIRDLGAWSIMERLVI